jgi:hypothetical protein
MNIIRKINYGIVGCHGILDIYKEDFYQYYLFFPLLFLVLPDNFIYFIIIIKSILHFSNDLLFLPPPLSQPLLLTAGIIGYKYRKNHLVLITVQAYLFFHSVYNISRSNLNLEKIFVLFIGFIFIINSSYLLNTIHELIYIDEPLNLKKRLLYSILCAHIRTNY